VLTWRLGGISIKKIYVGPFCHLHTQLRGPLTCGPHMPSHPFLLPPLLPSIFLSPSPLRPSAGSERRRARAEAMAASGSLSGGGSGRLESMSRRSPFLSHHHHPHHPTAGIEMSSAAELPSKPERCSGCRGGWRRPPPPAGDQLRRPLRPPRRARAAPPSRSGYYTPR
jgi:hypothetical protein